MAVDGVVILSGVLTLIIIALLAWALRERRSRIRAGRAVDEIRRLLRTRVEQ